MPVDEHKHVLMRIFSRILQTVITSLTADEVVVRLDSGADITLMSEECWKEPRLPQLKVGLRMKLYQLTGEAKVLVYMHFPIYVTATNGILVRLM
ncbi:hypothetical protein K435DRAFT_876382 [Dendrothele bispora CBS 962.96]|uniref:Peptidase A2 domain-containing protein n=1 Tax=Dendrothele bispora (strain CBS 962.96) TaxID=1314807 RepID=A0A4V4HBB1_DENBC|nr:hypothetical protein K435DRAFT_876382 [Dendrothele bispora CBS 962.96]